VVTSDKCAEVLIENDDLINEKDSRSLADWGHQLPQNGSSWTKAKTASFETIIDISPEEKKCQSVKEADKLVKKSLGYLQYLYRSYQLGDWKHPGDAPGDNGCDCYCHQNWYDYHYQYEPEICLPEESTVNHAEKSMMTKTVIRGFDQSTFEHQVVDAQIREHYSN
jgi:hypothetical protein